METNKRLLLRGSELREHPGWYKVDGRMEDESESWSAVRKADGSWWWVSAVHIFPPGGGDVRIDLGEQITEENAFRQFEEYYLQLLQELDRKKLKEGDRVRVIGTGVTGVVIGFGSVPGVPTLVNVAYDGDGGCNHMPRELERLDTQPGA